MNIRNENVIFTPEKHKFEKSETKRYDTEENYKNKKNLNINLKVHSLENIRKDFKNEIQHINGFVKPVRKHIITLKKGNPRYKSGKEIYKKELEILKIVNPDKMKLEEEENEKRINYLKKKIERDRQIKIIKTRHIRGKASRLSSAFSNLAKDLNENIE